MIAGLLLIKIEPFYESLFFLGFVIFLILYMILLIKDLDNPFDYSDKGESPGEVALFPIHEVKTRLENKLKKTGNTWKVFLQWWIMILLYFQTQDAMDYQKYYYKE